jgi:predicted secreted hydrolase
MCIKRISVWNNCLTYNLEMSFSSSRSFPILLVSLTLLLVSCSPATAPSAAVQVPDIAGITKDIPPGFAVADGSRPLTFPQDFGTHPDFRTEGWYYTGNLDTPEGRHFGFELTIFRVGLLPPTVELPTDSQWYNRSLYFAHFAVSDIATDHFYVFERYSRPGPGLAGAQADPYHVWLEDWSITEHTPGVYRLQAEGAGTILELTLTDEMGVILQGQNGYSRKGVNASNASYYYSQPRLRADGSLQVGGVRYLVSGLAWHDHEFGSGALNATQIGWDWFSLQFEDGSALMLFQLRERDGSISASSSGTFIPADGISQRVQKTDFEINVLDTWRSPHTQGLYPAAWEIQLNEPNCTLKVNPWMADQEINFPSVTYWEGAIHFEGTCNGAPVRGNGYVELTGYAGKLPLR